MSDLGTSLTITPIAAGDGAPTGIRCVGEIDAHTAPELDAQLDAFDAPGSIVALDLAGVEFMDSSGLRVVIATTERLRAAGGDLVVVDPSHSVCRLLDISGLIDHLSVATTT